MDEKAQVVEHIKLIQLIISRMSSAMLSIKALALTVLSLLVGFAAKDKVIAIFIALYPLLILFMLLDMFYLWQEHLYRSLYAEMKDKDKTDFSMDTKALKTKTKYRSCLKSVVIWPFYLALILINTVIFLIRTC